MNKFFFGLLWVVCIVSCKNKKLDSTKAYFSAVDYLKAEVKKIDTLPMSFIKITNSESTSDTSVTTKDQFNKYAREFTNIPDIASVDNMDHYTETNDFDEILNNVLLMYSAKKQDDVVRNETIMMQPDDMGNTHVKTILISTFKQDKDSSIEKNLTWHIDKRFQIVTKTNKPGQIEKISTTIISWE
jgi:hypothetical protein